MGVRVVPYAAVYPATWEAVPEAEFVRMEHDDHYRQFLGEMWERGEAFTLIEHDVVPTREQLAALDACPEPWCHFGYVPGDWVPTFGLVRFSAELIAGTQGVWSDPSWPWCQLDAKFNVAAHALGWHNHWHYPHVLHLRNSIMDEHGEHRRGLTVEEEMEFISAEARSLRSTLQP